MGQLFLLGISALLSFQTAAIAEAQWEWVNPLPQGHSLRATVAGNGVMVAVGASASTIASADGNQWTFGKWGTGFDLYDVIWANGQFVAIGSKFDHYGPLFGVILTSADGFQWVERYRGNHHAVNGVAWDGGRFVATADAKLLLSSDGETWEEKPLSEEIWGLGDIIWDGSRFVAIGLTSDETRSAFISEDTMSWQSQPLDCECFTLAIAWGNGRYVAVGATTTGYDGAILTSVDALTWEEQSWEGIGMFHDVIFAQEGFVAVGDNGLVASSVDGYVWSFQEPQTDVDLRGATEIGDGYLAVGDDGFMMTSLDGESWQELSEDTLELSNSYKILEMASGNGVVVGVGTNSLIVRSEDGGAWEKRPHWAVGDYNSVCWIGSQFWAVGDYGVARSPDGLEWELMLYDTDVRLFDVAWNGSVYVAVGWNPAPGEGDALAATSVDGLDWTYQWIDTRGPLTAIRWAGSRFVAVGVNGLLLTSPNGFLWSQPPLDEQVDLSDMEWNGDRLVVVGSHWETGRLILSSTDGVNWEECLPPDVHGSVFHDVAWTGDRFLAAGSLQSDTIFMSDDGQNWYAEITGTGLGASSVGGDERRLYATSAGGRIIRRIQRTPTPRRPERRVLPSHGKNKRRLEAVR